MIRTQISMTVDQAERLRRLSEVRQRSQAALMRDALDQLLASAERLDRVARARAAIGQFHSGRSDISRHHDDALVEAYLA